MKRQQHEPADLPPCICKGLSPEWEQGARGTITSLSPVREQSPSCPGDMENILVASFLQGRDGCKVQSRDFPPHLLPQLPAQLSRKYPAHNSKELMLQTPPSPPFSLFNHA